MRISVSRRALFGAPLAIATAGRVRRAAAEDAIKEADKIKQVDAKYQKEPKGQQRCEICLQFQPPASCKIVQGPITPQGWCQFFAAKENAH